MKKYARLWVLPLVLILVAFGMTKLAGLAWDSLVHFRAPQFAVPPGSKLEPISRVVVMVVVDGLRVNTFLKTQDISMLTKQGAFFILKVGQPSLSMPCSATIGTGAWQDITGVTTNWFDGPLKLVSLFSLAKENGMASVIVAEEGWGKLFGDQATKVYARKWEDAYVIFDEQTLENALEILKEIPETGSGGKAYAKTDDVPQANPIHDPGADSGLLLLVHFVDTDWAGHDFGGASREYQAAANRIGRHIKKLHQALPDDAILIITADHGQIDSGGHGGWEQVVCRVPLLILGKGIKPGDYGEANQTDLAPTVAVLAGLPLPPYSQGRALIEALDLGTKNQEAKVHLGKLMEKQKEALTKGYLGAIGADFDRIRRQVQPFRQESPGQYWERILARGKGAKIKAERLRNLPLALAVFFLPLLAFWLLKRKCGLSYGRPFLLALGYFSCFYGLFFASGKTISLSSINDEDLLERFFNEVMLYAGIAAVLATVALAFFERRKPAYEAAKSAVLLVAWIAFLIVFQIDGFFFWNGPVLKWFLPDMLLGFKYYLDMLTLVAIGAISPFLPFIPILTAKLAAKSRKKSGK